MKSKSKSKNVNTARKTSQNIYSKLTKTTKLLTNKALQPYIPRTQYMKMDSLRAMLQKEKMVYIKPCHGSLGRGVIRIEVDRNGQYRVQHGTMKSTYSSFSKMYRALQKLIGTRLYLVQKGIRLLTYKGSIFDIRVMVQRNARKKWEVTGIVGRVAHPRKAVTNGSQGGSIYPVETLLRPYLNKNRSEKMIATLKTIGLQSAITLSRGLPYKHEIGADIGIDRNMKPWIIEVNWNPDPCPFTKLPDRKMLRRIIQYAKKYGKTYNLKCMRAKRGR